MEYHRSSEYLPRSDTNGEWIVDFYRIGPEINHYIAIDPTAAIFFSKPEIVGTVVNQNLHALARV